MIYILLIFQLQRRILISNFHTCIDVMVFRNTPNKYSALLTGKEKVLKIVLQSLFCLLFIDWKHILIPLLQETVILIPNFHPLYFVEKKGLNIMYLHIMLYILIHCIISARLFFREWPFEFWFFCVIAVYGARKIKEIKYATQRK